jgi:hypothetical protein
MSYTTEVYRIIRDYKELEKYVDSLPDLGENYKYYISLFARKKYGGTVGLTSDKCQLKRCVASKDRIIQKLKQMEIPLGAYTFQGKQGEEEVVVRQQSLVVYISANPRNMNKSAGALVKKLVGQIVDGTPIKNPQAEALSQIQAHGKKIYFNVDIDFTEGKFVHEDTIKVWLRGKVNEDAYRLIRTRGGYHLLVELARIDKLYQKSWYNKLALGETHEEMLSIKEFYVDLKNGDGMLPIPGCVQSEFTPFEI